MKSKYKDLPLSRNICIIPAITPKKLLRFLKSKGFYIHHQVGSHIVLKTPNDTTRRISLPMHSKDLKPDTLSSILKQAGVDKKELNSDRNLIAFDLLN